MSEPSQMRSASLPVKWNIPPDIETIWANNMTIQLVEQSFVLTFFQTFPPLLFGGPEDQARQIDDVGSVTAEGKVRVVIPMQKLKDIIRVLSATDAAFKAEIQVGEEL